VADQQHTTVKALDGSSKSAQSLLHREGAAAPMGNTAQGERHRLGCNTALAYNDT
jgi:hypothetical protein